jgi:hypothetical protein
LSIAAIAAGNLRPPKGKKSVVVRNATNGVSRSFIRLSFVSLKIYTLSRPSVLVPNLKRSIPTMRSRGWLGRPSTNLKTSLVPSPLYLQSARYLSFQHSLLNFISTQRFFSRNPERLRKSPWISTLVISLHRLYIVQQLILSFLEAPAESVVRVLPYSSVPGMLTSSHSYFKAIATLAKQQNQLDPSRGAGSDLANASSSKGKKKTKPGEPFSFI